MKKTIIVASVLLAACSSVLADNDRPRARDIDLVVGTFPTGPRNAITDVTGW